MCATSTPRRTISLFSSATLWTWSDQLQTPMANGSTGMHPSPQEAGVKVSTTPDHTSPTRQQGQSAADLLVRLPARCPCWRVGLVYLAPRSGVREAAERPELGTV